MSTHADGGRPEHAVRFTTRNGVIYGSCTCNHWHTYHEMPIEQIERLHARHAERAVVRYDPHRVAA